MRALTAFAGDALQKHEERRVVIHYVIGRRCFHPLKLCLCIYMSPYLSLFSSLPLRTSNAVNILVHICLFNLN